MKTIMLYVLLLFLGLIFIYVFVMNYSDDHQNRSDDENERRYVHYANNPNKVWEYGYSSKPIDFDSAKPKASCRHNPNKTISKIQVLSTEHDIHNRLFFRERIETDIKYLCKIIYESGRSEVRSCNASFLRRYSDNIV